jgi:DNA-directed RNA polymerase specialized sigma24 family protein
MTGTAGFEAFVRAVEPGLRRALAGHLEREAVGDALAEAFGWAWEHWDRVAVMENPSGYLFRVAQSRSRSRKQGWLPWPGDDRVPEVEPDLPDALAALPAMQRSCVWLVHGCGWTYAETAEALGISASAVGTHVARALTRLRTRLGVTADE